MESLGGGDRTVKAVLGIHHVTAICGNPQENIDFYAGVLGMRLVKRSVNQDDPFTYHFFYADGVGTPGSDLTFFPWEHLPPGQPGTGLAVEVSLAIPRDTLTYWGERLEGYGFKIGEVKTRFGERTLLFADPHGMALALVEVTERDFVPWDEGPVPPEKQIRGLHAVRMRVRDLQPTARLLFEVLGFARIGTEKGWHRYGVGDASSGRLVEVREDPDGLPGRWGVGAIHHIAWRVADEAHQQEVRQRVFQAGRMPTPVIDRFWFKSVYFREPGDVLFELATDGPGFAVDEDPAHLGESLILPPWLEPQRTAIEARLPAIGYPPLLRE